MGSDRPELLGTPSGTTLRFGTLVGLALATTWFVAGSYASTWPADSFLEDANCQVRANLYLTSTNGVDPDEAKWAVYRECMSGLFLPRIGWLVGGVLLLLLITAAIYLVRPRWRIRRSRLELLDHESYPALWAKLEGPLDELVAKAGLARAPEFRLDPYSARAGGVAFGTRGKPVVCLDAGLVALLDRDRAGFDAVVLHELAHVRNGDVATTYATLSVWRAVLAVVLLPYLVFYLNPLFGWSLPNLDSPITAGLLVRVFLLVVLVYVARTAVLRSRERYADALVVLWTGDPDPYLTLRAEPVRRRVLRWIAIHPTRVARDAAMSDPKSLLRNGFGEALMSGLAIQLAWAHLVAGLRGVSWYREGNESFFVMRVVWGVAVAALVCVIALRGAAYLRAGGTGRWTFARPGLGVGLGLAIGLELDLSRAGTWMFGNGFAVFGAAILVLVTVFICSWAGLVATRLVDREWRGAVSATAVVVVCVSFLGWSSDVVVAPVLWRDHLGPAFDLVSGYGQVAGVVVVPFLLNFDRVLTAAAVVLLWLVPLLLGRGSARLGVLAGLAGGAGWGVVAVGLSFTAGTTPEAATARTAWELVAVAVVQVLVAVVVARRSELVTALLATWVVGLVGCFGIWALHLDGWRVDSVLAARPLQVLPALGVVAALLGAVFTRDVVVPRRGSGRLAVAAVLVASAVAVLWWPKAPQAALLLPAEGPKSVVNTDQAVNTWQYGGGLDQFMAVRFASDEVFKAFQAEDTARIAEACEKARVRSEEAAAFPEPPGPEVAASWKAGLALLVPGTRECVKIYRDGGGDSQVMLDGFIKSLPDFERTLTLLTAARERTLPGSG